jgi:hypothetical protein
MSLSLALAGLLLVGADQHADDEGRQRGADAEHKRAEGEGAGG